MSNVEEGVHYSTYYICRVLSTYVEYAISRHLEAARESMHAIPAPPSRHQQSTLLLWLVLRLFVLVEDGQQLHQRLVEVVLVLGPRQHHLVCFEAAGLFWSVSIDRSIEREMRGDDHHLHRQGLPYNQPAKK